ncbi:hypothetical protein [Candidatus Palauibacter sp.]
MPHATRTLSFAGRSSVFLTLLLLSATSLAAQAGASIATASHATSGATGDEAADVTFSRDIAPILQRA